jgi:5-deoxy-glucuronate isomerase
MLCTNIKPFAPGLNQIASIDKDGIGYGIVVLSDSEREFVDKSGKTRIIIPVSGRVIVSYSGNEVETDRNEQYMGGWRTALPNCYSIGPAAEVSISALSDHAEAILVSVPSHSESEPVFTTGEDIKETIIEESADNIRYSERIIIDRLNSKIALTETVNFPGRWSLINRQKIKYGMGYGFFKFYPSNGFGILRTGDDAYHIENNSVVNICTEKELNFVTAPGYYGYSLWLFF